MRAMFLHFLVDTEDPAIGDRVEVVLEPKAKRTGSILDLRGFRPART